MALTIWTVGHSVRPLDEFLAVLAAYDIELLVDVRRFPGSRRLPQYAASALEASLAEQGIGGMRRSAATRITSPARSSPRGCSSC